MDKFPFPSLAYRLNKWVPTLTIYIFTSNIQFILFSYLQNLVSLLADCLKVITLNNKDENLDYILSNSIKIILGILNIIFNQENCQIRWDNCQLYEKKSNSLYILPKEGLVPI